MMSKWIDCAMCIGAFHYQSAQYDGIKPPTYGALGSRAAENRVEGREREPILRHSVEDEPTTASTSKNGSRLRLYFQKIRRRRQNAKVDVKPAARSINAALHESNVSIPQRFQLQLLLPRSDSCSETDERWTEPMPAKSPPLPLRQPLPSLFLQETAHLVSLLNAVALSTLRNDIDQAATPVTPYIPGQPWPCVNPDNLARETQLEYGESSSCWMWIDFCLGLNRSTKRRTLYNAARPFGVLGGVSDEEVELLQRAQGPYAKVALVTMWLQEFISREYLAGSTGNVAGPLLSRLYQFISDGMVGYNNARKVAYISYPFVGAQITAFFSLAIIFIFPFLFTNFVTNLKFACVLNFFSLLAFLGIHEVARELESPFQNVPNDLPLTTFQAHLNETLVTLYAGYHPDSWWNVAPDFDELSKSDDGGELNC
jgi:Bestrophin, RFP-TM, chloride channel